LLNNLSQFRRELVVKTKSESGTEPFPRGVQLIAKRGNARPFPHARARIRSGFVFYGSKIFGRKIAQLSETLRESVYSGSACENRPRNTAG
jgi:hypothetical protein